MTDRLTTTGADDVMANVREGMQVHDNAGKHIGKVTGLFMGARADAAAVGGEPAVGLGPETGGGTAVTGVSAAFDDSLPTVLRARLRHNGYLRIHTGLLRGDRYALREHIASVSGDRVTLNVSADELIAA